MSLLELLLRFFVDLVDIAVFLLQVLLLMAFVVLLVIGAVLAIPVAVAIGLGAALFESARRLWPPNAGGL